MEDQRTRVWLALGSNLGDRLENLCQAREELSTQVTLEKCSSIYETPPWGFEDQPAFLNQVVIGNTHLTPEDLLKFVKKIESDLGRILTFKNGPRLIDIDILLYGDQVVEMDNLIIPHPRMLERGFVLMPLAEIDPNLVIPGQSKTILDYQQNADCVGIKLNDPEESTSPEKDS